MVECGFSGWGKTDCNHGEDIHLLCTVPKLSPPPPSPPPPPPPPPPPRSLYDLTTSPDHLSVGLIGALGGALALMTLLLCALVGIYLCRQLAAVGQTHAAARLHTADADGRAVTITLETPGKSNGAQEALASALRKALEPQGGGPPLA